MALRFTLNTEKQTIDSLEHWCAHRRIDPQELRALGCKSISDLKDVRDYKKQAVIDRWLKQQQDKANSGEEAVVLHINIEGKRFKLTGKKFVAAAAACNHPAAREADHVIENLQDFCLTIEYSDCVNDEKAPKCGLILKTFAHTQTQYQRPTPTLLMRLRQHEMVVLQPDMIIEVGSLRFLCERFNLGVVSKVGNRLQNEDSYIVTHDLGLDTCLKSSFYAIIDGHGGEHCSQFL